MSGWPVTGQSEENSGQSSVIQNRRPGRQAVLGMAEQGKIGWRHARDDGFRSGSCRWPDTGDRDISLRKPQLVLMSPGTMRSIPFLLLLAAFTGMHAFAADEPKKEEEKPKSPAPAGGHVFAWPFMDPQEMKTRGATTTGGDVTLMKGSKGSWKRLREPGLEKHEQDRRAILALAGNYRVSFDFTETVGLVENFKPTRPYFSWGTENVTLLEDKGKSISLQHSLVMYFKNDKGETEGDEALAPRLDLRRSRTPSVSGRPHVEKDADLGAGGQMVAGGFPSRRLAPL